MIMHDGHVHTPLCPHGSDDPFELYIEQALDKGLKSLSFTEHAPLPAGFTDPVPGQDSALDKNFLESYLETCSTLKDKYKGIIDIKTGLEIDYIEGFENEIRGFLDTWGHRLDDAILSVHFLRLPDGSFVCLDFSPDSFKQLVEGCGSLENVYALYYKTLRASVTADLGKYTPGRIGHMTLVRKFQKLFPRDFDDSLYLTDIIKTAASAGKSLDVNTAGLVKPHCGEIYPPSNWIKRARDAGVKLVYGSDAHTAKAVGEGRSSVSHFFSSEQ